jgi:uncharacterized protein
MRFPINTLDKLSGCFDNSGISTDTNNKWKSLINELSGLGSVVVAYSGGVDSSFLAYTASQVPGLKAIAITINSQFEPVRSLKAAADFAIIHGIRYQVIEYDPLQDPAFISNPVNRCYHCKLNIFHLLWDYAGVNGFRTVLDGENADDLSYYRPGHAAKVETGTLSPLANSGFTKKEIRILSKEFGLTTWNKPSSPCLATRFPYGTQITKQALEQISKAEDYLHENGFTIVRVRYYGEMARIEVDPGEFKKILEQRENLIAYFNEIGFLQVTLDLNGYRSGSLDEGLLK